MYEIKNEYVYEVIKLSLILVINSNTMIFRNNITIQANQSLEK